jgi:hypothetical protein
MRSFVITEDIMKRNYAKQMLGALLLLLATFACVLPGQTIQPAPITDPGSLETAIVGTALAAETQTQQALIISTSTPAPTATFTPTPKVSNVGTYLEYLEDGSTKFTDRVAGVQLVFPAQWLVVRVGEQEYYAAWGKAETQNPRYVDVFAGMQNLDPKIFRLGALDTRPDRFLYNDLTQVYLSFDEGDTRTLKQIRTSELKNHPPYRGYKVLSSQTFTTAQGLEALNMEIQAKSSNGASVTGLGYRRRIIFKVPGGSMALDLHIVMDKKDLTMPDFDQLINSVILMTP